MQSRPSGVRGLVFGGVMATLVVVFALFPYLTLLLPIPLVFAHVRYGGRVAVLTGIVAMVFCALFVGPVQAFAILVPGGILPGLVFGYGIQRKMKPVLIGIMAVTVFFLSFAANYVITRAVVMQGRDPFAAALETPAIKAKFDESLDNTEAAIKEASWIPPEAKEQQLTMLEGARKDPVGTIWMVLPFSLFMAGALSTWFTYRILRWILPRFGHEVPKPTPFRELRLPNWSVWAYFGLSLGLLYITPKLKAAPWWLTVTQSIVTPIGLFFVLVGIAVAYGWLRKRDITKPMAILLIAGGLFIPLLGPQLYVLLAMWDTIFDFRGLGHGLWRRPEGS